MFVIHNHLRLLRETRDIKQKDVADAIDVSRSTYANYESGFRIPDIETLTRIADFYQVSVDTVIGHQIKSASIEPLPDELLLIKKYRQLSPAGKERMLRQCSFEIEMEQLAQDKTNQ